MIESPLLVVAPLARYSAVSLEDLLHEVSSESIAHVRQRENTVLDRLLTECNRQCVIFGAGSMGQRALAALHSIGIYPLSFSDNNPSMWGETVDGIPVLSPEDAAERFGEEALFFIAIRNEN